MGFDRDIEGGGKACFIMYKNHKHSKERKEDVVERVGILPRLRKTKNYYTIK